MWARNSSIGSHSLSFISNISHIRTITDKHGQHHHSRRSKKRAARVAGNAKTRITDDGTENSRRQVWQRTRQDSGNAFQQAEHGVSPFRFCASFARRKPKYQHRLATERAKQPSPASRRSAGSIARSAAWSSSECVG